MDYIVDAVKLVLEIEGIFLIGSMIALAVTLRSALGFGDGLLAVPMLAFIIELKEVVPLLLLLTTTTSVYPLWKDRGHIQFDSLKRTSIAAFVGIPFGVLLLELSNVLIMKGALGLILIGLAIWKLNPSNSFRLKSCYWSYFFGALAGILGSAYALRGVVFSVYSNLRGWDRSKYKSTISGFYLISGVLIPINYFGAGLITQKVMGLYFVMLPVAVISTVIGHGASNKVAVDFFQKLVWIFLLLVGLILLIRTSVTILDY